MMHYADVIFYQVIKCLDLYHNYIDAESIAKVRHIKEYIEHKHGALLSLLTLVYTVKV